MNETVQTFLDKITKWVKEESTLLGLALVGSYARDKATEDSDVDLVLLSSRPAELIENQEWIKDFGFVNSSKIELWGVVTSIRVFYKDGLEIEYGLTSTKWIKSPIEAGTRQVIRNGMIILVDKKGLLNQALEEVVNSNSNFYYQ